MNALPEPAYVDEAQASYTSRTSHTGMSPFAQIVTTLLLSGVFYYLSPLIPFWPEYAKRAAWEVIVSLVPSQAIYAMDHIPAKLLRRTSDPTTETAKFQRSDFGNYLAKSEALRRIFHLDGQPGFVPAVGRARALSSGIGNLLGGSTVRSDLPPGLGNWDNSCYQNSIIQGLASLPTLRAFVEEDLNHFRQFRQMPTHEALRLISTILNDENNNGRSMWTPQALKSMSSWQQQDAQEYFTKIVDALEKEIMSGLRAEKTSLGLGEPLREEGTPVAFNEEKQELDGFAEGRFQRDLTRTKLGLPLEGLLAQRVGCMSCGYCEGLSLIPFTFLTVPLGRHYESDIRDCLTEYTAFETIEGVECSKCSVLRVKEQLAKMVASTESSTSNGHAPGSGGISTTLREAALSRLGDVEKVLAECDFSDKTLKEVLKIGPRNRVSSIKSRQAVIARPPQAIALHVNRSVFDEMTGAQFKNTAAVRFPIRLDLSEWCIGDMEETSDGKIEVWETDPSKSMLALQSDSCRKSLIYELRAVVTHQGRHENGHYVAFRKRPWTPPTPFSPETGDIEMDSLDQEDRWFRFSDESVSMMTEEQVLAQGGVFMLFYEAVEDDSKQTVAKHLAVDEDITMTAPPSIEESRSGTGTTTVNSESPNPIHAQATDKSESIPPPPPSTDLDLTSNMTSSNAIPASTTPDRPSPTTSSSAADADAVYTPAETPPSPSSLFSSQPHDAKRGVSPSKSQSTTTIAAPARSSVADSDSNNTAAHPPSLSSIPSISTSSSSSTTETTAYPSPPLSAC